MHLWLFGLNSNSNLIRYNACIKSNLVWLWNDQTSIFITIFKRKESNVFTYHTAWSDSGWWTLITSGAILWKSLIEHNRCAVDSRNTQLFFLNPKDTCFYVLVPNTTVTDVIEKHLPKMVTKQSAKSANTKIHCNVKSTCFGVIMRHVFFRTHNVVVLLLSHINSLFDHFIPCIPGKCS